MSLLKVTLLCEQEHCTATHNWAPAKPSWSTQDHRAESLHPAGPRPRHVSETGTQRHFKSTLKYLNSFPILKFCYHSFMSEVSRPPRRFTEFGSCLSCVGCTDLTHTTAYKASKILTCNKLFISTKEHFKTSAFSDRFGRIQYRS